MSQKDILIPFLPLPAYRLLIDYLKFDNSFCNHAIISYSPIINHFSSISYFLYKIINNVTAKAEDITVEMLNKRDDGAKMAYSQDITRVDVGDTVTWVPTSKGHNVHFIAGPEGWDFSRNYLTS